ncbi:TPA: hypothetical protein DEP58_03525 [Patescibacteria group bacterium]|nr:MAG: hypothetical protein UU98_C0013G0026 [Parcubacteria group bacterium GW2011_GWD2_42_14]HCC05350.1 hypothetical protein [Patescibacteria group bacterium]
MLGYTYYYGAAICRIIKHPTYQRIIGCKNMSSAYIVNDAVVYFKHSTKRLTPWQFTFQNNHLQDLKELKTKFNKVYIALICGDDGICCISYDEFLLITSNSVEGIWITADRSRNEKYKVKGNSGKLKNKIGNNQFPDKIL